MKIKKWSNAWIFRDLYWEHCGTSDRWLRSVITEGDGEERVKGWIEYLRSLRRTSLAGMRDPDGAAVLGLLKARRYRQLDGPGWDELYERALRSGCDPGAETSTWIAEWAIRTHGAPAYEKNRRYKVVLKPTKEFRQIQEQSLHWVKTEYAEYPWKCTAKDWDGSIRIGDFPIEHLYHVIRGGEEIGVTDDWPANWTREEWFSAEGGTVVAEAGGRRRAPNGSRAGMEAQIDRIMEKLGSLRGMDSGCKVFGAKAHRYRLGAPLSKPELSKIERRLGVPLPEEYRLFLMRAGHGGAGPYYGLFRLDGDDPEDITDRKQIRKPFRWDDSFNPCDLEDPASEEDVWFEELDEEDFDDEDSDEGLDEDAAPVVVLNVPGALYLCHCGCAIRCFLIVKGKCTGEVWLDSQADDKGILPECGARGERLGFLDWYEKWLDDGIAAVSPGRTAGGRSLLR